MPNRSRNSAVFPVYLSARAFGALLRNADVSPAPAGTKPSASAFLRTCLLRLAGPESDWPSTDEAVAEMAAHGFSVVQFEGKRFLRGLASEDATAQRALDSAEGTSGAKITPRTIRREQLLSRLLAGEELSAGEQQELEM